MPRREDQKLWIRRKAALLWADKGYAATSVDELCEATSLGKGALYYHIGSKEQLLFEISVAASANVNEASDQVLAMDTSAAEKLRGMSRVLMCAIAENLPEWEVSLRERKTLSGERRRIVQAQREHYESLWRKLLSEGAGRGEFVVTNRVILNGILGMFNYSYTWLRPEGGMTPAEIADSFAELVLEGLTRSASGRASSKAVGPADDALIIRYS
jgi:AcrR family transcriptional regulator